jgi:cell division protein FtsW
MYVMSNINFRWIGRLSKIGFLMGLLLLFLTFIFGEDIGAAKRSLRIFGISFQTIQLAEVLFIIYFAQWIARVKGEINNIKKALIPMMIYIAITCVLITSQKTSGGIIMGATYFMMLFISQLKKRYFFALLGSIILFGGLSIYIILKYEVSVFRLDTAKGRIESFMGKSELNKETIITEAAISRGGILPTPGGSVLMGSVGESFSDYIYAFLIEEYGILIGILVILLYLGLFYRIRRSAVSIQSAFGAYLAMALGFFIVFQALTHMLVCVGYFPATGETLPMISRGGMSIITISFCLSILLNISEEAKEDRKKLKEEQMKSENN